MKALTMCIMFVSMAAMSGASFAGANGEKTTRTASNKVAKLPPLASVTRPLQDEPRIRTIVFSNPRAKVPEVAPIISEEPNPVGAAQKTVAEDDPGNMSNEELLAAMLDAERRLNEARESLVAEQEKAHRERIRQRFLAARAACADDPNPECGVGLTGFPENP